MTRRHIRVAERIHKHVELKAPVAEVWRALTDPKEFGTWFHVDVLDPFRVGRTSRGKVTHKGFEDALWKILILEMEPEKRFCYTWHPYAVDPYHDYSGENPTLVEFELAPSKGGTRLTITESGFRNLPPRARLRGLRDAQRGLGSAGGEPPGVPVPGREASMRVMVIVKATAQTESGKLPTKELLEEMGRFNDELVKAGVMLAGEGLHPSSKGARVRFSGKERSVVKGPFPPEGMVAGFWLWKVKSMDEAIGWAKRCPNPTGSEGTLEIRQVQEVEDFEELLGPDAKRKEEHLRHQLAGIACNCN